MASISLSDALGTSEVRRETAEAQAIVDIECVDPYDYSRLEVRALYMIGEKYPGPTTGRITSYTPHIQELPRVTRQDDVATPGAINAEAGGQEKDHP